MKILIVSFLLLALGLYAHPVTSESSEQVNVKEPDDDDDINNLLETLVTSQDDEEDDEDDANDLAGIQGVFNVLAQVKDEQAKSAAPVMTQFWRHLGRRLFRAGRNYIRNRYCKRRSCNEEQEEKVMLQELMEEQSKDDEGDDDDGDDLAELQTLLNAFNKLQAKKMQGDNQTAEDQRWYKRIFRSIRKRVRKHFC